jgi:hypothetical protein
MRLLCSNEKALPILIGRGLVEESTIREAYCLSEVGLKAARRASEVPKGLTATAS